MKVFFISLFLGLSCLNTYGQENVYYQQGESLISIRNPQFLPNELGRFMGSHLDYGYFFKDRWLIGGGVQMLYSRLNGNDNDSYSLGLQLFSRYYFSPLGKKQQFIFFAEPRVEGVRSFSQPVANGGNFVAGTDFVTLSAGLFCAWRPHKRISFDIGLQSQVGWAKAIEPGREISGTYLGLIPRGIVSLNFHL